MKFQDDISNMNTYIHTYVRTYIRTSRNQYAPPLFQSWGHNYAHENLFTYVKDRFSHDTAQFMIILGEVLSPNKSDWGFQCLQLYLLLSVKLL